MAAMGEGELEECPNRKDHPELRRVSHSWVRLFSRR